MSGKSHLYFIIHKPYGLLSQFSDEGGNRGLGSLFSLPKDVYPVGRLDVDSEGLLILTNDRSLNNRLLNPAMFHERTYMVEVEGIPTVESLMQLERGLEISVKGGKHVTRACKGRLLTSSPSVLERNPPVNRIKHPITSWLEIRLTEGKNRQVRKMTAKIGHPTLRLIRIAIEDVQMNDLLPGAIKQISANVLLKKLKVEK